MKLLVISNWNTLFENNRTRELKRMDWVPVPNKMDGDGFSQLLDHKNGVAHYGAWVLILEVASKCGIRGTLMRDGAVPHNAQSLARITRGDVKVFEEAIPRLVSIGWITETEFASNSLSNACNNPAVECDNPAGLCDEVTTRPRARSIPFHSVPFHSEGSPEGGTLTTLKTVNSVKFTRPTLEEVKLLSAKSGVPPLEAEKFFNYYESNGWKVGRNPMKDWHKALANWKLNLGNYGPPRNGPPPPRPFQTGREQP